MTEYAYANSSEGLPEGHLWIRVGDESSRVYRDARPQEIIRGLERYAQTSVTRVIINPVSRDPLRDSRETLFIDVTEDTLKREWYGETDGSNCRCFICGYRFCVGDLLRVQRWYSSEALVCASCDENGPNGDEWVNARLRIHFERGLREHWYMLLECRPDVGEVFRVALQG